MRRLITATVKDMTGVMNRFTGVFARRQYNVLSIAVGKTIEAGISRITIVAAIPTEEDASQVVQQLKKQIDVLKVKDITDCSHVERELVLLKVTAPLKKRAEINALMEPFRGTVIDVGTENIVIQLAGTSEKIEAFIELITPYGIEQIARTGVAGFTRSPKNNQEL
ncbi:acetolactate synthase small subunit [Carnobacterium divergens]|uniref:acetolactate synthase small subunit n=1 Tax=Carnobacterium divergens TaxID=2748 RepID=UPI002891A8A1|nr:acetolactate synthase small subunit [Carnobacterium divergens]MDT2012355.1 acetolactate synthase small subunit [Carnobacterium divergens]